MHWLTATSLHLLLGMTIGAADAEPPSDPLFRSVDLNVGQTRRIQLPDGSTSIVKLLGVKEHRDEVRVR